MSGHCVDTSRHCIDMQTHLDMSRYILTKSRYICMHTSCHCLDILMIGLETGLERIMMYILHKIYHKPKHESGLTEQIFHGTQAFAGPTDMASSRVWENIILTITPTFDGVCGMLFFIIILVETIFAKYWHVCQCVRPTFYDVGCDRFYYHK